MHVNRSCHRQACYEESNIRYVAQLVETSKSCNKLVHAAVQLGRTATLHTMQATQVANSIAKHGKADCGVLEVQVHYRDHMAGRTMGSILPLLVREGPGRGSAALGLGANKGRPDHPMLPSPAVSRVSNIF